METAASPEGRSPARFLPGLLLCAGIAVLAGIVEQAEASLFGRAWIEAIVLAILIGATIRSVWTPDERFDAGIGFSARTVLEVAIVLLGATLSTQALIAAGPALLAGIVAVVGIALATGYALGRWFGLPRRMAVLIACGNAICGNSAIAAVAPAIGAKGRDVAAAIAFTAVLGVAVVLLLPVLATALRMTPQAYGILAGLTVYAVPQVLAATLPMSALSAQVGTLVKLVRVLMLGPVVLILSLLAPRLREDGEAPPAAGSRPPLRRLLPWFIIGFLVLAALRSAGLIPAEALPPISAVATWLTVVAMAALGLGVDVRAVAKAGPRVTAVVTLSLLVLGVVAFLLIRLLAAG